MKRRILLKAMLAGAAGVPFFVHAAAPVVEVYKSASCGCCKAWAKHLQDNGFRVKAHDVVDTAVYREKFGIPQALGSCHSARVQGYALEGHVPASEVKRLLAERPKAKGLAVPGMPPGSPGMEMEGGRRDAYDVLLVRADGKQSVYRRYDAR